MLEASRVLSEIPALTVAANDLRHVQSLILLVGGGVVLLVLAAGAYFVVANRAATVAARPPSQANDPAPPDPTAFLWVGTAVVMALVALAFRLGLRDYVNDTVAPASALQIAASQNDSTWAFRYPNGTTEGDKLMLPAGRPVSFELATDDDPATFLIPEFSLRTHVAPNTSGTVFVETAQPGTAHILGRNGRAVAEIDVVSEADFDEYMRVGPPNPYCAATPDACPPDLSAKWGAELYAQNACIGCHTRDGSKLVGPTFKGVYGRLETMTTGLQVQVDDAYIRESIRQPQAKIVKGFTTAAMPSFANLSDRKVNALIEFLKTVK